MYQRSRNCFPAVSRWSLFVTLLLIGFSHADLIGGGFEDEQNTVSVSADFEDAEALPAAGIDELSRNGFDGSQLDGEFQHSKEIEAENQKHDHELVSPLTTLDRIQLRHAAQQKQQILSHAALRWQRFGQLSPGIYELDEEDHDGTNASPVKAFEELDIADFNAGMYADSHTSRPFLQPARTPFSIMWDDNAEVKEAAKYAFDRIAMNYTRSSNASAGLTVSLLPRVVALFVDVRKEGMHADERAMAEKQLLDFAEQNGLADEQVVIEPVQMESPRMLTFLSGIVHRLWAMREFRTSIELKIQRNGVNSLTEAEQHYLHLRPDLIQSLEEQALLSKSDSIWVRHEDRRIRADLTLVPHPTVSNDEAVSGNLVRILEGIHENPDISESLEPPRPSDFAKLEEYLFAKSTFYAK